MLNPNNELQYYKIRVDLPRAREEKIPTMQSIAKITKVVLMLVMN